MKHRIDDLEIDEYDDGWKCSYKFKEFHISKDLDSNEIIEVLKQHYYKVIDFEIENQLYKKQ